jgi:hypothetical protein
MDGGVQAGGEGVSGYVLILTLRRVRDPRYCTSDRQGDRPSRCNMTGYEIDVKLDR